MDEHAVHGGGDICDRESVRAGGADRHRGMNKKAY